MAQTRLLESTQEQDHTVKTAHASSDGQTGRSKKIPEARSHWLLPQVLEMSRDILPLFSDKDLAAQSLSDLHKTTKVNTR